VDANGDPRWTLTNLSVIINGLRVENPNLVILLAQIIPTNAPDPWAPLLNAAIPAYAASVSTARSPVIVVDQYDGFDPSIYPDLTGRTNDPGGMLSYDGVHPNPAGEQWMAQNWLNAMRPYLNGQIVAPPPPATSGVVQVPLTSVYNVSGIASDGIPFSGGGLDASGHSYSGALLGTGQTLGGVGFQMGPVRVPDAVSSITVPLPAGKFGALQILASGVNGNQASQSFTVNYADGTTSSFQQSLSDWFTPQNFAGEVTAVTSGYRDISTGTSDRGTYLLYEYSFPLSPGKTVSSIVLPSNRNVVVLAMTLLAPAAVECFGRPRALSIGVCRSPSIIDPIRRKAVPLAYP
jgi:hypothetical protein